MSLFEILQLDTTWKIVITGVLAIISSVATMVCIKLSDGMANLAMASIGFLASLVFLICMSLLFKSGGLSFWNPVVSICSQLVSIIIVIKMGESLNNYQIFCIGIMLGSVLAFGLLKTPQSA